MEYQRTESAIAKNVAYKRGLDGMLLKRGTSTGNGKMKNGNLNPSPMSKFISNSLFFPIFHSSVPRVSNIRPGGEICAYDVIMHRGHSKEERVWNNSKSALSKRLKAERVPFIPLPAITSGSLKGPRRER